jgi:hypothetical protein
MGGLALYIAVFIRSGQYPFEEWKLTQFHASYLEYGFIKRGVIGTIFLFIFEFFQVSFTQVRKSSSSLNFVSLIQ